MLSFLALADSRDRRAGAAPLARRAEPERLVVIARSNLAESGTTNFAQRFVRELETERDIFDGVLCRGGSERVTLGTEAGGEPASGELVSGNFFEVLGVKPHVGRLLAPSDDVAPGAHPVVVLSYRYWQRRFGGDPSVVGKTLRLTGYPMTVIGVTPARDTKYSSIREPAPRLWYIPYEQYPNTKYLDLCVRTTAEPESMANTIRAAIAPVDSGVALFEVRSQQAQIEELLLAERMLATLASCFGVTAALLAALGLYGVLAFWVAQRRREIGIRMALGAERRDILKLILGRGMKLTLGGLLVGLLAALGVTRWVAGLLFGVSANDPLTFALVALLLGGVALLACYLPARRATKVDPLAALRQE